MEHDLHIASHFSFTPIDKGDALQSVQCALSVLNRVTRYPQGLTGRQIRNALRLNISTCYHILNTLMMNGYIERSLPRSTILPARSTDPFFKPFFLQTCLYLYSSDHEKGSELNYGDTPNRNDGERIERTIPVQDIQTHLFEGGSTSTPPILFLHGAHSGNLWLDYHRSLSQQFHVFAPDLPGFGLTPRPDWMRDMSDYVLYLHDLIQALELTKPFLIGHSLGGWMAAELAVWYPELVGKLILCNPPGIRIKGTPIADLFALNPQEALQLCFENLDAAAPLIPAEINVDFLMSQYKENVSLALLMWNPNYDPKLERRLAGSPVPR